MFVHLTLASPTPPTLAPFPGGLRAARRSDGRDGCDVGPPRPPRRRLRRRDADARRWARGAPSPGGSPPRPIRAAHPRRPRADGAAPPPPRRRRRLDARLPLCAVYLDGARGRAWKLQRADLPPPCELGPRPLQALGESVAVFPIFKAGALPESAVVASGAYGKEYASTKEERLVVHRRAPCPAPRPRALHAAVAALSPAQVPPGARLLGVGRARRR